MHIQVVNFHLNDLSDAEFRGLCDEVAPAFAEVPGLISKVWLENASTNTYGGIYTWEEPARPWRTTARASSSAPLRPIRSFADISVDRLRRDRGPDERDARARRRAHVTFVT